MADTIPSPGKKQRTLSDEQAHSLRNVVLELAGRLLHVGVGEAHEVLITSLWLTVDVVKVAVSADATSELHVFLVDGLTLGVDGTEVGVLEKTDDVGLGCFLKRLDGLGLEAQLVVHVLSDAFDESHEGGSWEKEVVGLLVPLDLAKRDGASLVAPGLSFLLAFGVFDTSSSGTSLLDGFAGLGLARELGGIVGGFVGLSGNFGLGHFVGKFSLKLLTVD